MKIIYLCNRCTFVRQEESSHNACSMSERDEISSRESRTSYNANFLILNDSNYVQSKLMFRPLGPWSPRRGFPRAHRPTSQARSVAFQMKRNSPTISAFANFTNFANSSSPWPISDSPVDYDRDRIITGGSVQFVPMFRG